MATSYALCLGVNAVCEDHYGSPKGYSTADDSALKLHQLFLHAGIKSTCLLFSRATHKNVKSYLLHLSEKLVEGDTLYVSFSGHGARVTEKAGFSEEVKKFQDRGWCLYDRVVFNFELWEWARKFSSGVRIVVLSDACYSGILDFNSVQFEALGGDVKKWTDHKDFYKEIILNSHRPMDFQIAPTVLVLSASARDGDTFEDTPYTVFMTSMIDSIVNHRHDNFNYFNLYAKTVKEVTEMRREQTPRWHYVQGHQENSLPHLNIFEMEKMDDSKKVTTEQVQDYEVLNHHFYGVEKQLKVEVANPSGTLNFISLSRVTAHKPSNVHFADDGNNNLWVNQNNHHLILRFKEDGNNTPNPIIVKDTRYYDDDPKKHVDVICADISGGGNGTGKKVKRAVAMVKEGGGGDGE